MVEGEILKKKIKKENINLRFNIFTIITYIIGTILIVKLFELQIIKGATYRETSNNRLSRESKIEAARGDIVDRSGNVFATTTTMFNLELYKTKSDDESLNECILNLTELLDKYQKKYPDNFPINQEGTSFTIEGEELSKWLTKNKLQQNSTPEDAIKYFKNKYKINEEDIKKTRKIIAIRYEITTKGYSSTKSLTIAEDVPREVLAQISERNTDFPGITITTDSKRKYNYGTLASHIIGYIGKISETEYNAEPEIYENDDYVGRTGIESSFEKYLRGIDGKQEIEMSVDGTVTGESITEEAIQGSSVVLTIDAALQEVAEKALKNNIEKIRNGGFSSSYDAKGGAVVVMDVKSGEVLAMASNPDYDPNLWVGGISKANYNIIKENNSLFNKSISGSYAPGSIYKMVTAISGLETGAVTKTEKINDTGIYYYGNNQWKCWYYTDYHRGHGYLDVSGAIQHSCNFYFYEVARRMGIDNLVKYARYFGLGSKTGIELPSETAGTLASKEASQKKKETWSGGDTLNAAIGQGDNDFSPIQIAKYISMVANGGNKINPTIIKTILNADGTEASKSEINEYVRQKLGITNDSVEDVPISKENLNAVLEGMRSVTYETGGTAYNIFKNFDIEVGGKTGSAEAGKNVNAWFVGFAPYNDPEIAVVVLVENGGHGNYTAEVARDIIAEYFGMNMDANEIKENNEALKYTESID